MRLIFDIEANGFLDEVTKVHCIAAADIDTGDIHSFDPSNLEDGLALLQSAEELYAHNGLRYDYPVLKKLYGFDHPKCYDTLVLARLIRPNIKDTDENMGALHGSHSLEAWGKRLRVEKGDYPGPWDMWTPAMHEYCIQDVRTTLRLYKILEADKYPEAPKALEHRIAIRCAQMELDGWPFDVEKAQALHVEIVNAKYALERQLCAKHGGWYEVIPKDRKEPFVPKKDDPKRGYRKGVPIFREHYVEFNPNSRQHMAKVLMAQGWVPQVMTEGGQPKVDEAVLKDIAPVYHDAELFCEYLTLNKLLGFLADGDQAWLKVVDDKGFLHPSYNPMGAVTSRASHFKPNIAQVPSRHNRQGTERLYGKECRELFRVPDGWLIMGADMSGLELRCFAHYLAKWDKGEYAKIVTEGDVHTFNQQAAGLPTRPMAKTFIYAWLYGAGASKIGKIVDGSQKDGIRLINAFMERIPAVARLRSAVAAELTYRHGLLPGLDGRLLPIRSEHAAVNTLLQSAGAILCKQWVCDAYDALVQAGFKPGWNGDFVFLGWIHDELQIAIRDGIDHRRFGDVVIEAARNAGVPYGFRCPLDAQYKIGKTWADTH